MALLRSLVHAVLVPALLAGCSPSLFDDGTGDDGLPDAGPEDPDGGSVVPRDGGGQDDGGVDLPDASSVCGEGPCNDDAYTDFSTGQGGKNGRWRYVEVRANSDEYVNMTDAEFPPGNPGWEGTGTPAPSIVQCAVPSPEGPCFQLEQMIALTTTAPGANHPALLWIVPREGSYTISGTYQASGTAPAVDTTILLTHNDQANELASQTGIITTEPGDITANIQQAQFGDLIVLTAIATTDTPVSVGLSLRIVGPL